MISAALCCCRDPHCPDEPARDAAVVAKITAIPKLTPVHWVGA
ncbi:hypothetical protein ASAP_2278 [Asaia bogorensis]|uniref:Uncharacterized protein n=1 Tax=Asaia bogorensis TaxID=91915 RepID=A0A060QI03_9PROT|nr:hypothetical protein ASAP_2278 [Asaia bogorensis]